MDVTRIRDALASELRYHHAELVRVKRELREVEARLTDLYDREWWNTPHSSTEINDRMYAQQDANRRSSVLRADKHGRESAIESLRNVRDALRPRRW